MIIKKRENLKNTTAMRNIQQSNENLRDHEGMVNGWLLFFFLSFVLDAFKNDSRSKAVDEHKVWGYGMHENSF